MARGKIDEVVKTQVPSGSGFPLVLDLSSRGTGVRATVVEIGTGACTRIRNRRLQPGAQFFLRVNKKRRQGETLLQLGRYHDALVLFRELGEMVWDSILSPIDLDRIFDTGGFAIHARCEGEAIHLPLEIAYNRRFLFERNVLTFRGANDPSSGTIPIRSALIVADPSERFNHSYREGLLLCEFLESAGLSTTLISRPIDCTTLRELLPEFDIFHFSGHSVTRKGCTGWDLGREIFTSSDLLSRSSPPAFVFSSSCGSTLHLGLDLLRAGVVNCICSRWQIPDADITSFILSFYHRLLGGAEIGLSFQRSLARCHRLGEVLPLVFVLQGECGVRYETTNTRRPY
jgi:hypothetical protein